MDYMYFECILQMQDHQQGQVVVGHWPHILHQLSCSLLVKIIRIHLCYLSIVHRPSYFGSVDVCELGYEIS